VSLGRRGLQEEKLLIERRKLNQQFWGLGRADVGIRGYVALAVATERGVYKRELSTGLGDREGNMIAFAAEALILLRDVIKGDAKL
jgi:hypothetical protein